MCVVLYFVQHSLKAIPILIGPFVNNLCRNGWKTCFEYLINKSVHKNSHKAWSFAKADWGKFMGPIIYLMIQFLDGERNFTLTQSMFKMLQNQDNR